MVSGGWHACRACPWRVGGFQRHGLMRPHRTEGPDTPEARQVARWPVRSKHGRCELDESLRDDVEEAADVCPLQAITVKD
jgi:ferredoxin